MDQQNRTESRETCSHKINGQLTFCKDYKNAQRRKESPARGVGKVGKLPVNQ